MIGLLPKTLEVAGVNYDIRSDFRPCLHIIQAFSDNSFTGKEKAEIGLRILYKNLPISGNMDEAYEKLLWFLDCGKNTKQGHNAPKLMNWDKDEQYVFAGISAAAKRDVREDKYCHWWTFCGYYVSIDSNSTFVTITHIRRKLAKNQKLETWEREFYNENLDIVSASQDTEENMSLLELLRGGENNGG